MTMLPFFGSIYGAVADARNALYRRGIFKSFSLGVPTISIGNITVGGTGKTPLVASVAEILAAEEKKVGVLTRGYGRANERARVLVSDGEQVLATVRQAGDEPLELACKLLGKAVVVADADRVAAGQWAREQLGVTAFVLDDGFQHRRVRRHLDIVCVDATRPFGNGKVLPSGILREPLKNLSRADLVVVTRANLVTNEKLAALKRQIADLTQCPVLSSENKIVRLTELPGASGEKKKHAASGAYHAFCALGNPQNFFEQLERDGFQPLSTQTFADHHFYEQKDVEAIEKKAAQNGAGILLTTAKDAVKLGFLNFSLPCLIAETESVFDDEKKLREMIRAVL